MAFAKWQYPYTLTAEQAAEKKELDEGMEPWPEGANVELCDEFWGKLKAGREKWIEREKDFCELLFSWRAVGWVLEVVSFAVITAGWDSKFVPRKCCELVLWKTMAIGTISLFTRCGVFLCTEFDA